MDEEEWRQCANEWAKDQNLAAGLKNKSAAVVKETCLKLNAQTKNKMSARICFHRAIPKLFSVQRILPARARYSKGVVFETKPFEVFKLKEAIPAKAALTRDEALNCYRKMQTVRRIEASAATLYREKIIRGFCHLYSGQEAVAVGMTSVMREQDTVISGYRVHGWAYLMGSSVASVLSELTGKRTGSSRGKGGSMHLYARNFYGGNGIVGAQVPLGAGLAFAAKYTGNGGVSFALYGDGAANQGQVFEAYNMAKLWSLPCIFVCENNGYGMGTSAERSSASTAYYTRGDFIPGIKVDGMDVLAVRESTRFAIEYATSGKGPLVMEMVTYRYSGHSMSDPGTSYRSREEVQEIRNKNDPIIKFKEKIVSSGLVQESEIKEMDRVIKAEVEQAHKKAVGEKEVGEEELTADIYMETLESKIRNVLAADPLQHLKINKRSKQ